MSTYQTTYAEKAPIGLPGQIASTEHAEVVSRTVESAAGIAFGQPAFRGNGDNGVIAGAAFAATGAGSAAAGNTGTSTITAAPAVAAGAKQGRYVVTQLNTAATGALVIHDPKGVIVGHGAVGTAFTVDGITATVTGAGTPTAGDMFYIDVTYTANVGFVGLAVLSPAVPPDATNPDKYPQYFTGGFMKKGPMYVMAGANVVDGGDVYWNPATGRYTSTATHIRIPGAQFATTGGNGDIVKVDINPA
jgi:hypothetical protein